MIPDVIPAAFKEALKEYVFRRRWAYIKTFAGPLGDHVLADLAVFCRATKSTAHTDPHMAARLDGRREVWLRIQSHLQLSEDDLWKLLGGEK